MRLVHYWSVGAGLAFCGADTRHGELGEISTSDGDATCLDCLGELAECGTWPGAADMIRRGHFYAAPAAAPPDGYPRVSFKQSGPRCLVRFQASPYKMAEQIGEVRRFGSLPSCQGWAARGYWPGAEDTRKRDRRGDAGRDLMGEWLAKCRAAGFAP